MASSTPGTVRASNPSTSTLSSQVPRSMISASACLRGASQASPQLRASNASSVSSSEHGEAVGRPFSRVMWNRSPRDSAGSVVIRWVASPASAAARAMAPAVVVLPTPPLPTTKMKRCVPVAASSDRTLLPVQIQVDVDAAPWIRHPWCLLARLGARARGRIQAGVALDTDRAARHAHAQPFPPVPDLTESLHEGGLPRDVLLVADIPKLQLELELEQLRLHGRIVGQLLAHHAFHLPERELRQEPWPCIGPEQEMLEQTHRGRSGIRALEAQLDVHEVVGGPRPGVLEGELVVVLAAERLDRLVEFLLPGTLDQVGGVHDHAVADRLVGPARDRDGLQRLVDVDDVAVGAVLQRRLDEPAELHAGEVGGALRVARDLPLQPANLLVALLEPTDYLVTIPQHLEAELDLVVHLLEHVIEGAVGRLQQLDNVVPRAEDRAERHGNDRVLAHDRLIDELMREDILPGRVVDADGRVADDRGKVPVVYGVDAVAALTDSDRPEIALFRRLDDTIDVLALLVRGLGGVVLALLGLVIHDSRRARRGAARAQVAWSERRYGECGLAD